MDKNIGIIIQARMGSTRLPGKILRKFYGDKTLIEILLDTLHRTKLPKVIVATSVNSDNDILETFLTKKGELVYRGSENDVLDRFIKAAIANQIDGIIRICSDNPFLDYTGIYQLVQKAKSCDADYIGFRINGKPSIQSHFGFWGEYVSLKALMKVASTTESNSPAHEHVTIHIYSHPEEFKCEWIECPDFLQGRNDIRLTIDTIEDFINAQTVYSAIKQTNNNFSLEDIVAYLNIHEELTQSMLYNISNNSK